MIYGIISEFTDKGNFTSLPGQFQYLTLLRGLQGELTCKFDQVLSTAKNLSIGYILLEGDFVSIQIGKRRDLNTNYLFKYFYLFFFLNKYYFHRFADVPLLLSSLSVMQRCNKLTL